MVHQRSIPRSPSSTGAIKSATTTASISPHSANFYKSGFKSKSSDLSQHNDAESSLYSSYAVPARPRRHLHPAAVAPGADPRLSMRHRRGGGFEDPSYNIATSAKTNGSRIHSSCKSGNTSSKVPIPVAVLLWYFLGVISIATSKTLLSTHNVPPLVLTMQQLIIGMTLLRTLLEIQTSGEKNKDVLLRKGLQPIPMQGGSSGTSGSGTRSSPEKCEAGIMLNSREPSYSGNASKYGAISAILALIRPSSNHGHIHNQLFLAAIYFGLGFLFTNYGFQSGSAAFVETIKAAEPFTSASVAVLWGIEQLGKEEVTSLTGIVAGVVLSTLGHRGGSGKQPANDGDALVIVTSQSLTTKCLVVMLANLCFSFRGLHQKLFRSTPQGNASLVDDLNLQYRMQQIGVLMLIIPTLLGNASLVVNKLLHDSITGSAMKYTLQYILLSLVNGLAFTSYNLASTYILTRISVVHHAALNCIRRVFAIIVTSIIFGLKITLLQVVGIAMAVTSFFSFMHFKMKKETKDKRRKELRQKWGGIITDSRNGRWIGKSSSLLPVNSIVN
ncbi:hypothetical protein ACHAXR_013312 [Thalassiosira sp. AJA248-18]